MLNIIKSDLFRILKGKAIYISFLVVIILSVFSIVGMSSGYVGLTVGTSNFSPEDIELQQELSKAQGISEYRKIMKEHCKFELDKDIIGHNINLYYIFIVIAVIVLCTDFSNKSIKNTLSSAISRKKYYFSKLIFMMGLGTLIILFNNYFVYFLNLIVNGENFASSFGEFTKYTIIQLPLLYGIISLLVCFAFVFRKTSSFNTISIPFVMIVQIIGMAIINLFKINGDIFYNYEVQFALLKLVSNPTNDYIVKCAVLGLAYIIIFNLIGYFSFKKAEIK